MHIKIHIKIQGMWGRQGSAIENREDEIFVHIPMGGSYAYPKGFDYEFGERERQKARWGSVGGSERKVLVGVCIYIYVNVYVYVYIYIYVCI